VRPTERLSVQETAAVIGISEETVMRDWRFAKRWLPETISKVHAQNCHRP
jgi:DNA-directed RNA polymerase specialized sigma24 family protein